MTTKTQTFIAKDSPPTTGAKCLAWAHPMLHDIKMTARDNTYPPHRAKTCDSCAYLDFNLARLVRARKTDGSLIAKHHVHLNFGASLPSLSLGGYKRVPHPQHALPNDVPSRAISDDHAVMREAGYGDGGGIGSDVTRCVRK